MSPLALGPAHGLNTLEFLLPCINQVGGLTEVLELVAFLVWHSAGQRVRSRGRLSDTTPQSSQAVVDQSFRPGVLIGDSPGTLSVRDHMLLGLRGVAFELRGLVARLPHFSTNRFMSRPAVADFPGGAAQFCTRCFMGILWKQWPNLRSCRRSWSFWALSSSSATSEATAFYISPSSCSNVTFFMVTSKTPYSSAKVSRACVVFWFMS